MMWLPKTMSGRRDAQNLIDQHSIVRRAKLAQSARSCDFGHVEEQRLNMAIFQARSCPPISRSEEHTSELQSLMRISYAVFCLKKKRTISIKYHKLLLYVNQSQTHTSKHSTNIYKTISTMYI